MSHPNVEGKGFPVDSQVILKIYEVLQTIFQTIGNSNCCCCYKLKSDLKIGIIISMIFFIQNTPISIVILSFLALSCIT